MPITIIKETIEITSWTTDANGNAWFTKKVNLQEGKMHSLLQVDIFEDVYPPFDTSISPSFEVVISPYPAIPTDMQFLTTGVAFGNRYPSAGDDSVLFKAVADVNNRAGSSIEQFPSRQIAANNFGTFYTDHVYINVHWMSEADTTYTNFGMSFMMVVNDKNVSALEHNMGVVRENHNAMCALVMSNGHMRSRTDLRGNVFPMWRFGGMRPEHTLTPTAANTFFLDIASRDAETMSTSAQIRTLVSDARQMQAYDAAFGLRRPDWLREFLNAGYESGPIRPNPVPLRYADNGNTRMF
tara:strand:+ start:1273 stop:2163 length:891 start_codon:yes stop_codon:yes gene_type:complete